MPHSETYAPGVRVELIHTTDEHTTLPPGTHGTVAFVDGLGTVHIDWDNNSTLGIVPGSGDEIRRL